MFGRWLFGGLAIALLFAPPLRAQRQPQQRPLGPQPDVELRVAPFFDGFYTNPDGTTTFSFGYSNLNRDDVVEIPLGPDNFIQPKDTTVSSRRRFRQSWRTRLTVQLPAAGVLTAATGSAACLP